MAPSLGLRIRQFGDLIGQLRAGLPFSSFERLCAELNVAEMDLASLTHIASRTLARRKKEGRLQFVESERVYRFAALFDKAVHALGSVPAARQWMKSPKRALRDVAPLEFARTEIGAREVEDLLGRIEHGVFS